MAGDTDLQTPRDFVNDGWQYQKSLGQEWLNYTRDYLSDFQDIAVAPMTFEVPAELTIDYGNFLRPVAPDAPEDTDVVVTMPTAPTLDDIAVPSISDEPDAPDFTGLSYAKPAAPNRALPTRPADTEPVLLPITVPDAPDAASLLPADPVLYALDLDLDFALEIPEFTATAPVRDFDVPPQTFAWSWSEYDETMIDTVKDRLSDMVINGLGLPAHIETALFDRLRGREDVLTAQAISEYTDELAARGLRQPAGLLSRGLDRLRTAARQRTSSANRDLTIEMARMEVENVKFALSTAITLEVALVQANVSRNELALRGAQAAQEVAINLFNARVALHNTDVAAFKVEAEVFGERIRALQAQADVLRTQVEAQKAIGEVNESLVRAYGEKMRAVGVLVDIYRAQVEGARVTAEINTQTLEQARVRLQGFQIDVEAWAKEQDAYRTSVEAELGNIRAFEALGNVYGRRVEAWATRNRAYFDQGRFQIETQVQQLERFKAQLQGAQIDSQVQLAAVDAKLRRYATQGSIFAAEAQVSAAESAAQDRNAQMRLETGRLRIETAQKNLQLSADYALKTVDAQIETLRAKAQIVSQLAASSQSGVNFGASYSGSLGYSYSKSASIGYSGDAPEFNSVPPSLLF